MTSLLFVLGWLGCSDPGPPSITFTEVGSETTPALSHTEALDPDRFWGPGVAVGDVDGDGRIDVYLAGAGGLYLNRPDPSGFRLEPATTALPGLDLVPIAAAFGDCDRDGDLDLAVGGHGGVRLLENDGSGSFTDVTAIAGVAGRAADLSLSVAWGDIDGDGYLDLAVGNYGFKYDEGAENAQASHLYVNQRDRTFVRLPDVLDRDENLRRAMVVGFADFDSDGALDLYIADDDGIPFVAARARHDLFLTSRGLTPGGLPALVESSAALGLDQPRATMGFALGNADGGPGWDFFVTDIRASWLYRSPSAGEAFQDVTAASAIDLSGPEAEQWTMWGTAFADLDRDGHEDLLVSQAPVREDELGTLFLGPQLLRNRGDDTFDKERYAFGGPMHARATVLADLDGDGDDDAIVAPFFDRFRFFRNDTAPRPALRIELRSTVSAPGAAGAVVVARGAEQTQKRMRVSGGQPSSMGHDLLDIAMAGAGALAVTVTWPSGAIQDVGDATAGKLVVTEPRWIEMSEATPSADGSTVVQVRVDLRAAGLGDAASQVVWTDAAGSLQAVAGSDGVAIIELPPRTAPEIVRGTLSIDGRAVPAHPAITYR